MVSVDHPFAHQEDTLVIKHVSAPNQLPLILVVKSDDLHLQHQPDVLWLDVLSKLDYRHFQKTAARYYEYLWRFNQQQAKQRHERRQNAPPPNPETQAQATKQLLFSLPTKIAYNYSLFKKKNTIEKSPFYCSQQSQQLSRSRFGGLRIAMRRLT